MQRFPALLVLLLVSVCVGWFVHARSLANRQKRVHDHIRRLERSLDQARRDPVTGLATRPAFIALATELLERHGSDLVVYVIMADLDYLKRTNDSLGHAAGTAHIRATADRLRVFCGDSGVAGRLHGDEFAAAVALDPGTALGALRELQKWLQDPVDYHGQVLHVTTSMGWVNVETARCTSIEEALDVADKRMYRRKPSGRPGRRM